MAQETRQQNEAAAPSEKQDQQPRPCPQDCRRCGMNQQIYCATQMVFNMSRTLQETRQKVSLMELALDDVREQLQPKREEGELSIPFSE